MWGGFWLPWLHYYHYSWFCLWKCITKWDWFPYFPPNLTLLDSTGTGNTSSVLRKNEGSVFLKHYSLVVGLQRFTLLWRLKLWKFESMRPEEPRLYAEANKSRLCFFRLLSTSSHDTSSQKDKEHRDLPLNKPTYPCVDLSARGTLQIELRKTVCWDAVDSEGEINKNVS